MNSQDDKLPRAIDGVQDDSDNVEYLKHEFENRFNCVDDSRMTLPSLQLL